MQKNLILILYIFFIYRAYANDILISYATNYTPKTYLSGAQNWGIDESKDGNIFIANNGGLLIKQGNNWRTLKSPKGQILRCVKTYKNKIYVGGGEQIGYFTKNKHGEYIYRDLTKGIDKNIKWGEIWNFIEKGDYIYAQGGQGILLFNKKNDKLEAFLESKNTDHIDFYRNKLLVHNEEGLFYISLDLKDKKIIPDYEKLTNKTIRGTFTRSDTCIIATLSDGIYYLTEKGITATTKKNNQIFKTNQIYRTTSIGTNLYAFGTILDGIYITDANLNIKQHINTTNGLYNNTVLSLKADSKNNLWAGLDYGISYIETGSQFYKINFKKELGTAYTSTQVGEITYWGTNQGLFYSKEKNEPTLINGTQGQVYFLEKRNNQVICGHHHGLFIIDKNNISKISNEKGFRKIYRLHGSSNYYIVYTYRNIYLYYFDKENNTFIYKHTFNNKEKERMWSIHSLNKDTIWSITSHSFIKAYIDTINMKFTELKEYKAGYQNNHIYKYGKKLIFEYNEKLYTFDNIKDKFTELTTQFYNPQFKFDLLYIVLNTSVQPEKIYSLFKNSQELIQSFIPIRSELNNSNFSLHPKNKRIILNGKEGFICYQAKKLKNREQIALKTFFSEISSKVQNKYEQLSSEKIPYKWNNIRFKFYTNDNSSFSKVLYKYRLKGFEQEFSPLSEEYTKEYTNLYEGKYTFEVISYNGVYYSKPTTYTFIVSPPLYRSTEAKITYFLLLIISIYLGKSFLSNVIKKKENKIREQKQKELEEIEKNHKIEKLKQEKTIITMEKEKLETAIQYKQQELANSTHNIVTKNELLINIKEELESIYAEKDTALRDKSLKKIFNKIDTNINNETDWEIFEKYFNEIHQSFFKSLKERYPDLSPTELKLCAYLRLNKTSKEIAALMNISLRGVETARYRLRKKLHIERDDSIQDILFTL